MDLETLWIDPVDTCNLKCIMCSFRAQHTGKNTINLTDFLNLLGQAKEIGVKNLNFGTTIEPSLYREMPRIIHKSKKTGFNISMITNLNFIGSGVELFKALTLVDNLFISIDAATKKTYEDIRKLADWSLLKRNLEKLGQLCTGQNIIARFAIQRKNINEIAEFVDFIYGFKAFKEITFEPVHLVCVDGNHKSIAWDYEDLISCKKWLSLAYKRAKEYGLKCKEHLTLDAITKNESLFLTKGYNAFLNGCFQFLYESRFPHSNPCYFLKSNLFISPKMEVYPCPSAYRAGELLLGDLKKDSLGKILSSDLVEKLQDGLSIGIRQNVCRYGCSTFEGQTDVREY